MFPYATARKVEQREISRIAKELLGNESSDVTEDEVNDKISGEIEFQEKLRNEYTDYFFNNLGTGEQLSFSEWSLKNYPALD